MNVSNTQPVQVLLALGMLFTMAFATGACGDDEGNGGGGGNEQLAVGCIIKDTSSPFWLIAQEGCERGAKTNNVKLIFGAGESESDIDGQIAEVEDAVTRGADALVVAPSDPVALQPVLERAAEEVPVVLIDTDIPDWTGKAAFIGTDNVSAGKVAAEYIVDNIELEDPSAGKLGVITGRAGITSVEDRVEGLRQGLEDSGIEIVSVLNTQNCARDEGVSTTEDLLTAQPDLDGIFYACDNPMLGGIKPIRAAGYGPDDLFIVGFDALPEAVALVEKGVIDGDIAQFPDKMAAVGIKQALQAANGKELPAFTDTGVEVVTKENASEFK